MNWPQRDEDEGCRAVAAGVDGEAVVVGAGGGRELPEQTELAVGLREQVAQPAVVGLAALLVGRDEAALAEVGDLAGQRRDRLVALDPDLGVARGREAVVARVEVVAQQVERLDASQLARSWPLRRRARRSSSTARRTASDRRRSRRRRRRSAGWAPPASGTSPARRSRRAAWSSPRSSNSAARCRSPRRGSPARRGRATPVNVLTRVASVYA